MPAQHLLLSWKDHNGALVSVFEYLLKTNSLVDCTLAAEGQYLKAHKLVLSACSSYFELLFNQESEKNPIVILNGVKFAELECAINFMYTGEVEVREDRLAAFLEVADTLQIKGLGSVRRFQTKNNNLETPAKSTKSSASHQQLPWESSNYLNENAVENGSTAKMDLTTNYENAAKMDLTSYYENAVENENAAKIDLTSNFENAVENENAAKMDLTSNFQSLSQIQLFQRDTSNSSQSLAVGLSVNLVSHSDLGPPGTQGGMESSFSSSLFPIVEAVPTDENSVIKTEPVTDASFEEKCDEMERNFDDKTMTEDEETWDEPNPESMGDDAADDAQDHDVTEAPTKSERSASEDMEPVRDVAVSTPGDVTEAPTKSEGSPSEDMEPVCDVAVSTPDDVTEVPMKSEGSASEDMEPVRDVAVSTPDDVTEAPTKSEGSTSEDMEPVCDVTVSTPDEACSETGMEETDLSTSNPQLLADLGTHTEPSAPGTGDGEYRKEVQENRQPTRRRIPAAARRISRKSRITEESCIYAQQYIRAVEIRRETYSCRLCPQVFSESSQYETHKQQHAPGRFKCTECGYATTSQRNLKRHVLTHTGERPFKCQHCNFSSARKDALVGHMRSHSGERPFKCQHCNYSPALKSNLTSHMRIHSGEKPFKCQHCNYSSAVKSNLTSHMRIHTGERPFKCQQCDFSSAGKGDLIRHMHIHTGERPFKCQHCSYSSALRGNLTSHMRIHSGEKPFKCQHCGYCFTRRDNLTSHLRTQSCVGRYNCKICGKRFVKSHKLRDHIRDVHVGLL